MCGLHCKNQIVVLTNELLGGIRKLDFLVKLTEKNRHNHYLRVYESHPTTQFVKRTILFLQCSWGGVCGLAGGCGLVLVGVVIYYFILSNTLENRMIGMT